MSVGNAGGGPRKPPGRAQGHRKHQHMALVPYEPPETEVRFLPDPPEGLEPEIVQAWGAFWSARKGPAQLVDWDWDADMLCRYFRLRNEELLLERQVAEEGRTTTGSQGQQVQHPAATLLSRLRPQIFQLGHQFGLTPRSRVSFAVFMTTANRKSKEDLNREANERARHKLPKTRKAAHR